MQKVEKIAVMYTKNHAQLLQSWEKYANFAPTNITCETSKANSNYESTRNRLLNRCGYFSTYSPIFNQTKLLTCYKHYEGCSVFGSSLFLCA